MHSNIYSGATERIRWDELMIPGLDSIEKKVADMEAGRDGVMQASKELIRMSGKAIALMHAQGPKVSTKMIADLKKAKERLSAMEKGFEYHSMQAHQEFSEALILYNILISKKIPSMEAIGESEIPYLLGLMDVVGELKREAVESMRRQDNKAAQAYYALMSDIYDSTLHMRFANSILPDFRRKQDVARIQIESVMNEMLHISQKAH
jgi:translin